MRHGIARTIRKRYVQRSLIRSLALEGKINVTLQQAKKIRPVFEKLVTKSKNFLSAATGPAKDAAFRHLTRQLKSRDLAKALSDKVSLYSMHRNGGYTRILKLSQRRQTDFSARAQISIIKDQDAIEKAK